jgi:hypothetical protein
VVVKFPARHAVEILEEILDFFLLSILTGLIAFSFVLLLYYENNITILDFNILHMFPSSKKGHENGTVIGIHLY